VGIPAIEGSFDGWSYCPRPNKIIFEKIFLEKTQCQAQQMGRENKTDVSGFSN
jgi:hypothetical protein